MSDTSRYKDTLVYLDGADRHQGRFIPPPELSVVGSDWRSIQLTSADVTALDALSVKLYGPGSERLWWSILLANGIVHRERELYPGLRLFVPPVSTVRAFIDR